MGTTFVAPCGACGGLVTSKAEGLPLAGLSARGAAAGALGSTTRPEMPLNFFQWLYCVAAVALATPFAVAASNASARVGARSRVVANAEKVSHANLVLLPARGRVAPFCVTLSSVIIICLV